ncbi:aminotransferase class I/II-fold pyridoxal phosphate-dependent enzyme [Acididesulfobacillus acetoxydans]|uniref:aminotransferase class I/II-fold pyridoxal phosphate-dependent enzyme n=1 Tax=Acididesulfobacillus acetoxydans TaxID=1561005 RepID=UPI001F0D9A30|nr:aminotransferase class I/II-fold pyridoxal phosphate-dependent enzyme [Acididesulfobacillus acetoxydans]
MRYEGEKLPNLLEMSDKVVYLGTFSKVLAPGLRLGYIIADEDITRHLQMTKEGVDLHSNNLTQRAVCEFLSRNLLPEHILKLREVYGARRHAMIHALERWLGEEVEMVVPTGGLFLWAKLRHVAMSIWRLLSGKMCSMCLELCFIRMGASLRRCV